MLLHVRVISFGTTKCMPCSKCHVSIEIIDVVEFNVAKAPTCVYGILDKGRMLNNPLCV